MSAAHPPDSTEQPTVDAQAGTRAHLPAGTRVGRYLVEELLGEGGMGAVYKAFDGELSRAVALKVIVADPSRSGTLSTGRERLLREAQALAKLSHPNVLPVYDVGLFGDEVFIATEFVRGVTLRAWLKAATRTPLEIVEVFVSAGEGLAAAHRANLVHRDFKPDNVMVGDDGRIRVLDFGLVRAARLDGERERSSPATAPPPSAPSTSERRSASRVVTGDVNELLSAPLTLMGSIMGTPRYMAPEQHRGDEVDARTDQFAFAIALYEALYRRTPFEASSVNELRQRVLAGELVVPSYDHPIARRLWPAIARALSLSPEHRFASMDELLAELRRELDRASRRRWPLVVSALAATATALGAMAFVHHQRGVCRGAERKLVGVWDPARRDLVRSAFLATKLPYAPAAYAQVERMFDQYARDWTAMDTDACEATQLRHTQSQEVLDLRMECLDDRLSRLGAQAEVLASADANVVERASQTTQQLAPLDDCADVTALRAPVRPPADAATRAKVVELRKQLGRAGALEAAGRYADGLAIARAAASSASSLRYRPIEAEALLELGTLESSTGDAKAAVDTLRAAALAADAGRADTVRAEALIELVEVAGEELGRYPEAHTFADEAALLLQRAEHREPLLATLERNRGIVSWREGKLDVAVVELQQALALRTKLFGAGDRRVAEVLSDIADAQSDQGKLDEALEAYRRALVIWVNALGDQHPQVAVTINNMANVLATQGKLDEALAEFRRAQSIWERSLGLRHPKVGAVLNNIGDALAKQGHYAEALDCYRRALPILEAGFGPAHYTVGVAHVSSGEAEAALGRSDAALASLRRGLDILEKALGPTHPQLAIPLADVGDVLAAQGHAQEAMDAYRRAEALVKDSPESPELSRVLVGMGKLALERNEIDAAVAQLERALSLRLAHPGDPLALAEARFALGRALWKQGRERRRARELVQAARDGYQRAGVRGSSALATVDEFLARVR